jgi:hypothetical protein
MTPVYDVSPSSQPEFVSPHPNVVDYLDADIDDIDPQYCTVHNILGAGSPPGLTVCQVATALHLQIEGKLASFTEAERHKPWHRTMLKEIDSIENNKMWRLVPLLPSHRPIRLKWVCKLKKNVVSEVVKHKARLVMKGYIQQQGVDFE